MPLLFQTLPWILVVYKVTLPECTDAGQPLPPSYPPLEVPEDDASVERQPGPSPSRLSNRSINFSYFLSITVQSSERKEPEVFEVPLQVYSPSCGTRSPSTNHPESISLKYTGIVLTETVCCQSQFVSHLEIGSGLAVEPQDCASMESLFESSGRSIEGISPAEGDNPPYDLLALRRSSKVSQKSLSPYLRSLAQFLPPPFSGKSKELQEIPESFLPEEHRTLAALMALHQTYHQLNSRPGSSPVPFQHLDTLRSY